MKAALILEDGSIFPGERFGNEQQIICEMVFNTGLTGYLELLTDASYVNQGIVMTSPHIGNYGIFREHSESFQAWAAALIVREPTTIENDARSAADLDQYLKQEKIPGLYSVDTRSLTLHLRQKGTMRGMITRDMNFNLSECLQQISSYSPQNLVARVSRASRQKFAPPAGRTKHQVALLDYGCKQNLLASLGRRGCEVEIFPWNTSAAEIIKSAPSGVLLSNGPGDPADCAAVLPDLRVLYDSGIPMLAICLGHQLLGLATGARTRKLKFGHRGVNHPVKDLKNNRVYITSQNHGYVIMEKTIDPAIAAVSHLHLNDGSIEGLSYRGKPIISVQFHPEGAPGPQDSDYLFDEFMALMASGKG